MKTATVFSFFFGLVLSSGLAQAQTQVEIPTTKKNLVLDVSGQDGQNGSHGRSGRDGQSGSQFGWSFQSRNGENGGHGQSGSNGSSGQNAGNIFLKLSYADANKSSVRIIGQIQHPQTGLRVIDEVHTLNSLGRILLHARGGDGGHGGHGGDGGSGGDGARGDSGSSGCPPGDGENGGNGGNGGDGGDAGDGGSAGAGGQIRVEIADHESELLLLISADSSAGSPGDSGRPGSSGRAGSGGWSGSGGMNTCSSEDPNRHSSGRSGWSGSSGSSGDFGRRGRPGPSAPQGVSEMRLSSGLVSSNAFHLRVLAAHILDQNEDGLVEPGETFEITQVTIANPSALPTPQGQDLQIRFLSTTGLELLSPPLELTTRDLASRAQITLSLPKGAVVFRSLSTKAENLRFALRLAVNQISTDIGSDVMVAIREALSVELLPVTQPRLYFGESTTFTLRLQNHSQKSLGGSLRPGRVHFEWTGQSSPPSFQLLLSSSSEPSVNLLETSGQPLPEIPAGASQDISFQINPRAEKGVLSLRGQLKSHAFLQTPSRLEDRVLPGPSSSWLFAQDLRSESFKKDLDIRSLNIRCTFPGARNERWEVSKIYLEKKAGADYVLAHVSTGWFLTFSKSPQFRIPLHDFAAFFPFSKGNSKLGRADAVALLNQAVAPATIGFQTQTPRWVLNNCAEHKR